LIEFSIDSIGSTAPAHESGRTIRLVSPGWGCCHATALPAWRFHRDVARPGNVRIGISGWSCAGWHGGFYPNKLPHRQELALSALLPGQSLSNGTPNAWR